MSAIRSNFQDQMLDTALPALDALIFDEMDRHADIIPELFRVYSSNRWGEQTSSVAGLRASGEKLEGEAVSFDDPIEGYDKTYTHSTFALAVSFSEEIIEDDRLNLIADSYRSLGGSMYQTRQINAMAILNNGFSDTGPDGSSLFNSSHTLIGGGSYNNRPSTDIALSVAGLREAEVDLMRQVDHRSLQALVMPEMVVCPPDIKHTAVELLKSQDRPDTANRAMNTFYPQNYKLLVSPYLTSVTAWFMMAGKNSHQLRWYDRVKPETKSWEDEKNGSVNTRIRSRFSVGYSDWMGTWGTSG